MEYSFKGIVEETESSLGWNFFILVPPPISKKLLVDKDKRVVCVLNNSIQTQIALFSLKEKGYCIYLNKSIRTKLKAKPGMEIEVKLAKDVSEYGIATPSFFKDFCEQDPEGSQHFHSLTPGKQRTLLHLVSKIKSENKQIEKLWVIFDYLKNSNGKLDFKELNEAFKQSRFK